MPVPSDSFGVRTVLASAVVLMFAASPAQAAAPSAAKQAAVKSVDKHASELIGLSDQVWGFAETALREHRSAKVLADYAEAQGFKVERGVAGMPTAFVATYRSAAGRSSASWASTTRCRASRRKLPRKRRRSSKARRGHGCGHNMFGAGEPGRGARDQGADRRRASSRARSASTARRPKKRSAARPTWRAMACSTIVDVDARLASGRRDTGRHRPAARRWSTSSSSFTARRRTPRAIRGTGAAPSMALELFTARRQPDARAHQADLAPALHDRRRRRCAERRARVRQGVDVGARLEALRSRRARSRACASSPKARRS